VTRNGVTLSLEEDRPMTRKRLRFFFLVAAIGSAASVVLDVSSHQAMAASVNLDSTQNSSTGSVYTLGYVSNTTITTATDSTVVPLANTLGANPTFTSGGIAPAVISAANAAGIGWAPASTGSSWLGPNSIGTSAGVGGTPTSLDAASNFVPGFSSATGSAPQGLYYYSTTFALPTPGVNYGIAGGSWMSDNQGAAIFLNGINLGTTNPLVNPTALNGISYSAAAPFSAPSADFNTAGAGLNTLTFVVWNENYVPAHGSPQGIEIQGTVTAVPEPTAIAVVVSGLPLIGLFWAARRRRRCVSV
jgi:hypothetical protein